MPKSEYFRSGELFSTGKTSTNRADGKAPFDIDAAMDDIREGVRGFRKAALFELFDDGFKTPFEQLLACIISIRTRDEDTVPISRRLFARARTPAEVAALTDSEIDALIAPSTFHEAKAPQIREIARKTVAEHGGELPCELESLLAFRGVGIKCANLVLGIACGQPRIGGRYPCPSHHQPLGICSHQLTGKDHVGARKNLPQRYWVEINALLVPFGKHVCTGNAPRCSHCPVLSMCGQIGVTNHR